MIARKKNYFEVKSLQAAANKRKTRKARQPKLKSNMDTTFVWKS